MIGKIPVVPLPRMGRVLSLAMTVLLASMMWLASCGIASARAPFSAIAVDASTGKILFSRHCDSHRYPASLTKVMTLYLLFEDLRSGKVTLSTRFTISRHAAAQAPSKLGLKPGSTISVRNAIGALVTKSANDIAVAVAENLEGSEKAFAARMTRTARELGMTRTHFDNASGLPDRLQRTTARDMATLALRMQRDFPKRYAWFSTIHFTYHGRTYRNHNHLLGRLKGVDGVKTGYTRASGFNLIASIERGGKRIVGVVMGGRTSRSRNAYMTRMLEHLFRSRHIRPFTTVALVAGHPPGYVPKHVARAIRVARPPLPQPKPDLAWNKDAGPKVVDAVLATDSAGEQAKPAAPAPSKLQPTSFQSVTVRAETFGKSDAPKPTVTGEIGGSEQLSGEKALAKAESADQPAKQPAHEATWNIQVGAFPTAEAARQRIDAVLSTGVKTLDGKSAFTMKAAAGNATIYRARFSGFDQNAAQQACRLLKRKGMGCFALAPTASSG